MLIFTLCLERLAALKDLLEEEAQTLEDALALGLDTGTLVQRHAEVCVFQALLEKAILQEGIPA